MVKRIVERTFAEREVPFEDAKAANKKRVERELRENRVSERKAKAARPYSGRAPDGALSRSAPERPVVVAPTNDIEAREIDVVQPASEQAIAAAPVHVVPLPLETPEGVADRYVEAMHGKATMPSFRELSAAVVQLNTTRSNGQVAQLFGLGYATGARWVSQMAGLQRISDDVWPIVEPGLEKGELHLPWLVSLSRQSPEDQLRLARERVG